MSRQLEVVKAMEPEGLYKDVLQTIYAKEERKQVFEEHEAKVRLSVMMGVESEVHFGKLPVQWASAIAAAAFDRALWADAKLRVEYDLKTNVLTFKRAEQPTWKVLEDGTAVAEMGGRGVQTTSGVQPSR